MLQSLCLDAVAAPVWLCTMLSEVWNHTCGDIDRTIERMHHVKLVNSRMGMLCIPSKWSVWFRPTRRVVTTRCRLIVSVSFLYHYHLLICAGVVRQCMQSARALGLPDAPLDLHLIDRKRQIAEPTSVGKASLDRI